MSGIYGINFAPLVLIEMYSHYSIAHSGYVNDFRTFGASLKCEMHQKQCQFNIQPIWAMLMILAPLVLQ